MEPLILRAHTVEDALEAAGIQFCGNKLIQLMGGGYFYVEYYIDKGQELNPGWYGRAETEYRISDDDGHPLEEPETVQVHYHYRICDIPLRLAWFVIDALKLKAQVSNIGHHEYAEVRQAVYLTTGKEIFGHKVEKLTKIPAELRPVVVEKL